MAVHEQLVNYKQENLYPLVNIACFDPSAGEGNADSDAGKQTLYKDLFGDSAISSITGTTTIPAFLAYAGNFASGIKYYTFDASTFKIDGAQIKLTESAKIDIAKKVENAITFTPGDGATNIQYDGSAVKTINQIEKATKLTHTITFQTSSNSSTNWDGSTNSIIQKLYQSCEADTAKKLDHKLTLRLQQDPSTYTSPIAAWDASVDSSTTINAILKSYQTSHVVNQSENLIEGYGKNDATIIGTPLTIIAVDVNGNINRINGDFTDNKDDTRAKRALCISRTKDSDNKYTFTYEWSGDIGGGLAKSSYDASTAYPLVGYFLKEVSGDLPEDTLVWNPTSGTLIGSPYMLGGNIYQTSDETLKTFTEELDVNLDNLATIKKGLFYWNHDENKTVDIGITAQSVEPLFPQIVSEVDGVKSVSYSKLSVVALAAIDKLYSRVKELEEEVKRLKESK